MSAASDLSLFFGRFHPLLVHLPIGLLVLLAVLEVLSLWPQWKNANASAGFILALAVPLTIVTVVFGWLLSLAGGYDLGLVTIHKYTGIATGAICLIAGILFALGAKRLYRFTLFIGFLVLTVTSHYGGSLTHGSDYLVRYAPGPVRALLAGKQATPEPAKARTW